MSELQLSELHQPVPIPEAAEGGSLLSEYVALLAKCRELQTELASARQQRDRAEVRAWTEVAAQLHVAASQEDLSAAALGQELWTLLKAQGIETKDLTGELVAELAGGTFEILTTREAPDESCGRVLETWSPLILWRGAPVQPAKIIVGARESE